MKISRRLVGCVSASILFGGLGAASSYASSYPSVMNRTECMLYSPNNICGGAFAPVGDHVSMVCWTGDGPIALGQRKWFMIASQDGGGGFVPAPSVSNQTISPWCGF
jgi:hypothetical protein